MDAPLVVTAPVTHAVARLVPTPSGPLQVPPHVDASAGIRLSLVIPTFNEARNIESLVTQLEALLTPVLAEAYELIVVDDDSPDRTWEVALKLAETRPRLRVMRRTYERGLSTAVIRGWQVARGSVLGVMDADLQHPPEINLKLLEQIDSGAQLATASRHVEGGGVSDWRMSRRILSRGAQLIGLLLLPDVLGRLSDPMSGYFMVRRSTLAGVSLDPLGYKILIEVVGRANVRWIGEVGYVFRERELGESKVTARLYVQYLLHLLRLRWAKPSSLRFVQFCLVGGSGVLVDMALLYLLSDPSTLGLGLTRSKLIASETAIVSNFLLNDLWTFREVARLKPGMRARLRRFLSFNAICSAGLLWNLLLLNVMFNVLQMNRYVANLIAIALVTGWNYWLNRKLSWSPLTVGSDDERS